MKIYYIYMTIPENVYNKRIKYLVSSSTYAAYKFKRQKDCVFGLYAWSSKKKIVEEFKETRFMDIFTIKKKSADDDDIESLRKEYSYLELSKRDYYTSVKYDPEHYRYSENGNDEHRISVVTTKQEHIEASHRLSENMNSFYLNNVSVDYKVFTKKIQESLDVLGYTSIFDLSSDTTPENDEYTMRRLKAENHQLRKETVFGNELITFDDNEYLGLMYLFSYLFFGV